MLFFKVDQPCSSLPLKLTLRNYIRVMTLLCVSLFIPFRIQVTFGAEQLNEAVSAGTDSNINSDAGMIIIPGGTFIFGTSKEDPYFEEGDVPARSIFLPTFYIDKYEFPNRKGVLPKVNVSWYEAKSLCEELGKRLCTEEEWEKACKGPDNFRFPYGNDEKDRICHGNGPAYPKGERKPSGSMPECVSKYGVYDMSGNVNEWTSSFQSSSFEKGFPILKGGDYGNAFGNLRCSNRDHYHRPQERFHDDGFRCCRSGTAAMNASQ